MQALQLTLVFVGAGCGGVGRLLLAAWIDARTCGAWQSFALGIPVVNALGSLLIGFCGAAFIDVEWVRPLVLVGLLGGFTTFSTFSLQAVELLQAGRVLPAVLMVSGSLVAGILGAWAGLGLDRAVA